MPYRITHVKACQGHDQTLIDKVGTAPHVKQVISLDYQFGVEELGRGLYPRVPIFPHLAEAEVAEEFRIVYTIRHGMLCNKSSVRASFQAQAPAKGMFT